MLLKYLFATALLLGAVFAGIQIYNHFFTSDLTLDKQLASRTMQEIEMFEDKFSDHVVSLEPTNPGEYRMVTQGIDNGQDAGRIGYNVLVVLDRENIKMNTPRTNFTIFGYQDDELIIEIHFETNTEPEIILHGPFAGTEYEPTFSRHTPTETPHIYPGYESSAWLSLA